MYTHMCAVCAVCSVCAVCVLCAVCAVCSVCGLPSGLSRVRVCRMMFYAAEYEPLVTHTIITTV
jgi:hypothetical protein